VLAGDGTLNYEPLFMFAYKAIHEMTGLGKELTRRFYRVPEVYSFYQGCSEGGREGFSQVQRYGSQFDGAVVGAPAIRMASQQVLHLHAAVVEGTHGYVPSRCEVSRRVTDLIESCDGPDGKADGVVSRTDLCKPSYNTTSAVGKSYSGAAGIGGGPGGRFGSARTAAANETMTAKAAAVVQDIYNGMFDF
jgi:tannase